MECRRTLELAVLTVLFLGMLLGAVPLPGSDSTAWGFVRSRTKSCRVVFWPQSCLYVQPDGDLLGPDLDEASVESAIQSAIKSWNEHLSVSSFMQLRYLPPSGPKEVDPLDGLQLIKFRRDTWCRPVTATAPMSVCFDPSATAITTVTFINRPSDPLTDGTIIDADIDFNAVNFHFYDATKGPPPTDRRPPIDLWNTATHELGHVMGLEHTCVLFSGAIDSCVVDDQNRPVPDCNTVEESRILDTRMQTIYEATMYPSAAPGETAKRLPHADDVAGVITAYPKVSDPRICKVPTVVQNVGCAAAAHPAWRARVSLASVGAAVGASLVLLSRIRWGRRRRRALSRD